MGNGVWDCEQETVVAGKQAGKATRTLIDYETYKTFTLLSFFSLLFLIKMQLFSLFPIFPFSAAAE